MYLNGQYYLKAYTGQEQVMLHFDTGNVKTDLYGTFTTNTKMKLKSSGIKGKHNTVALG